MVNVPHPPLNRQNTGWNMSERDGRRVDDVIRRVRVFAGRRFSSRRESPAVASG